VDIGFIGKSIKPDPHSSTLVAAVGLGRSDIVPIAIYELSHRLPAENNLQTSLQPLRWEQLSVSRRQGDPEKRGRRRRHTPGGRESSSTNSISVCNFLCHLSLVIFQFSVCVFISSCFAVSVRVNEPDCSTLRKREPVESQRGESGTTEEQKTSITG